MEAIEQIQWTEKIKFNMKLILLRENHVKPANLYF